MKKFFLILFVAALVGSFAFAEVTGVMAPTLSGSVTTTFGYDLDTEASGFYTDASVNVVVPLAAGSDTHAGMGGAYAEITIEDIDISLDTGNQHDLQPLADGFNEDNGDSLEMEVNYDAEISAKLVFGALWIGLNDKDFAFNNVDQDDADDINLKDMGGDGISVGYKTDAFSFAVQVASAADGFMGAKDDGTDAYDGDTSWTDSEKTDYDMDTYTSNVDNEYAFGALASIMAGPATVDVQFAYFADNYMGFGATAVVAAGPATITVPFDYVSNEALSENGMEIDPSVAIAIDGVGTITADFFFATYDTAAIAWDEEMNFTVTYEAALMDALSLKVAAEVTDISEAQGDMGWNLDIDSKYDMGTVAPYLNGGYGSNEVLDLQVGADLMVIDNATVTIDYKVADLTDKDTKTYANELGRLTVAVSVSY